MRSDGAVYLMTTWMNYTTTSTTVAMFIRSNQVKKSMIMPLARKKMVSRIESIMVNILYRGGGSDEQDC